MIIFIISLFYTHSYQFSDIVGVIETNLLPIFLTPIFQFGSTIIILSIISILFLITIQNKKNQKRKKNYIPDENIPSILTTKNSFSDEYWTIPIVCNENENDPQLQRNENFETYGICIVGQGHIDQKIPCQDYIDWKTINSKNGIICVSDGLSSAKYSDIGAKLIVDILIAEYTSQLNELLKESLKPELFLQNAITVAHHTLLDQSKNDKRNIFDYSATIIICLILDSKIYTCHIGDGAVLLRTNNLLHLLSPPENLEYDNIVHTICNENYLGILRLNSFTHEFDSIAVFSDGIQRVSLIKNMEKYSINQGFFGPIFSYISKNNDKQMINSELKKLLSSEKMNRYSDDDKSLVIFFKRDHNEK